MQFAGQRSFPPQRTVGIVVLYTDNAMHCIHKIAYLECHDVIGHTTELQTIFKCLNSKKTRPSAKLAIRNIVDGITSPVAEEEIDYTEH